MIYSSLALVSFLNLYEFPPLWNILSVCLFICLFVHIMKFTKTVWLPTFKISSCVFWK